VKFTRNGKITVELDEDPGRGGTQIRVRDTGIGIARANVERIFDDFVTLDASYARPSSGTGLGLGIVRRIVAQLGGSLSVDSREGEGSLFRVHLPFGRQTLVSLPTGADPGLGGRGQ
jgi:signal transduction histidine kinase